MSNFIKLNKSFLDLNKYTNYTYIEVLLSLNIRIPHLCYHNQLPVSGNCRLCLGVIGADRKPAPLCATSVRPNDIVDYNSARVRRLRQDVLEFLLLNHPMDCPSCDQGGECDLQDYSYNFGTDRSRHTFSYKKAILNKDRGALIKTVMNRCINCTRCTRFFAELVGSTLVGIIGRGINSEISSYVDTKFADCEFSGNVIDLCPVGALTSHANAFAYRPWNLKRYNSIDILDSLGSNLTFHLAGSTIVKITPRINYNLNLNWISDKARYMFDGLNKQRILTPLYRTTTGNFIALTWKEALNTLVRDLNITKRNINLGCYFGDLLNNETIFIASKFMDIIGNPNKYSIQDNLYINNDFVSNFIFNSKVTSLSTKTDMCFIFGSNLKSELPLVNLRLRKQYLATALSIITFGVRNNLMYPTYFFGFKMKTLLKFFEGTNNFCKYLFTKKFPTFLINHNIFKNETIYNIFNIFKQNLIKSCTNISANNFNYIYPNMDLYNKINDYISSIKYEPLVFDEFKEKFSDYSEDELIEVLEKLVKEYKLFINKKNKYLNNYSANKYVGRISIKNGHYGFVSNPYYDDFYVDSYYFEDAMDKDTVLYTIEKYKTGSYVSYEAKVIKVVKRYYEYLVGEIEYENGRTI